MSTRTFAGWDRIQHRIADLCRPRSTPTELLETIRAPLAAAVPHAAAFLSATDPATTLYSSALVLHGMAESMCAPTLDNEFLADDFNKFVDLHRTGSPASTLHRATLGRPERSARYRDVRVPFGFEYELRATLSIGDACWGVIELLRGPDAEDFSDAELAFVDDIRPILAAGLRSAMTGAPPLDEDPAMTPAVILLDGKGIVQSMTDRASELLEELGHRPVQSGYGTPLPGEAYIVGARSRALADGRAGPDAIARVRTRSGGWLTIRGECTRDSNGEPAETVLVIEPSRTSEVLPLFVAAHGLSEREKEVLAELVDGRSTSQIADVLFISSHTVRDHVKSILSKVGVTSRGELISELYRLYYHPSLDVTHLP